MTGDGRNAAGRTKAWASSQYLAQSSKQGSKCGSSKMGLVGASKGGWFSLGRDWRALLLVVLVLAVVLGVNGHDSSCGAGGAGCPGAYSHQGGSLGVPSQVSTPCDAVSFYLAVCFLTGCGMY